MSEEKLDRKDPRFRKIQITVDAYLPMITDEDGFKEGLMTFQTFPTDVLTEDRKEVIGTIGGGLGAVTFTRRGHDEGQWMIHHDDLWYAFLEALENV